MPRIGVGPALLVSGCSFGFVAGPPPNHAELPSFSCNDSRVAPALDAVGAVSFGLTFARAAGSSDAEWDSGTSQPTSRATALPVFGLLTALELASLYYGVTRGNDCIAARQLAWARVQSRVLSVPQFWPPQLAPPAGPPGAPVPAAPPTAAPAPSPAVPAAPAPR